MQIVSEAIFERLKEEPLLYTATHNRLAYLTSTELVVREIAMQPICSNLKIRGRQVISISLQNPHYIVILYVSGLLEVRKVEELQYLVLTANNISIKDEKLKIRVSLDAVYVLCGNFVEKIHLSQQDQREQIFLSEKQTDYAEDMLISSILQEEKILILQFPTVVSLEIEGIPIARLEFERVTEIKLLRDPLLIGNINMKEYLLVVEKNKWLKVYDVITLQQILEMELFIQKSQAVDIKIDPLHEYLMLRVFNKNTKATVRNHLLKINKQYYLRESRQSFFLFDIELGLKQDLILFPTHVETINGVQFHSIDMCFFTQEYIKIATLVVDINHRTRLYHTHHFDPKWIPIEHWNEIVNNLKNQQPRTKNKQKKVSQIQYKNQSENEWNKFIRQFWHENMEKFQSQGYHFAFDKQQDEMSKCIEYSGSKHAIKENLQMEDALNTLSGSSSFRSSGEALYNEQLLLRMIEGIDLSIEESKKLKLSDSSIIAQQLESSDIDESDAVEILHDVQDKFLETTKSIDKKIDQMEDMIGRIEDVHVRKLRKIQKGIRQHTKEVNKLHESIPKWCSEQMSLFASDIKENLNNFNATVTRLQIMGTRRLKKMKKGYRDFLDEEVQSRQQKTEENEQAFPKKLENLMKELQFK